MSRGPAGRWLIVAAAVFAGWLHFAHIGYGLPHIFNGDEPHIVNLAVSFGAGTLKPYSFKYPTFWPAVLFVCYGVFFLFWSGFGLLRSVGEFSSLFVWDPTVFYLMARGLAAALTLLSAAVVWRLETENRSEKPELPWGALLIAFSPVLVEGSHTAKPDALMLLLASVGWLSALRILREGGRRWYWACGAALGLAMSAQYTALMAALLLPLAHVLGRHGPPGTRPGKTRSWRFLAEGLGAALVGFFAGSPYILLDFPRWWATMRDFGALAGIRHQTCAETALAVRLNLWNFAGGGSAAGLAMLVGLVSFWRRDRRKALLILVPILGYSISLSTHPDGGWMRYLFGCFPGLALLAGEGLSRVSRSGRTATVLAAAAILVPGIYGSVRFDRALALPDTRTIAGDWMRANVPEGSGLLMDSPHACPLLVMVEPQLSELEAVTRDLGSPRRRLYAAMRASHPGGGYRIFRIRRAPADLRSNPAHVRASQAETSTVDVSGGLGLLRSLGVSYVVTSTYGATPQRSPGLRRFFDELHRKGDLVKEFPSVPGAVMGPHLRVFKI